MPCFATCIKKPSPNQSIKAFLAKSIKVKVLIWFFWLINNRQRAGTDVDLQFEGLKAHSHAALLGLRRPWMQWTLHHNVQMKGERTGRRDRGYFGLGPWSSVKRLCSRTTHNNGRLLSSVCGQDSGESIKSAATLPSNCRCVAALLWLARPNGYVRLWFCRLVCLYSRLCSKTYYVWTCGGTQATAFSVFCLNVPSALSGFCFWKLPSKRGFRLDHQH